MATTSETPCSRCPGNCLPNTCLPSTAKPAPGRPGLAEHDLLQARVGLGQVDKAPPSPEVVDRGEGLQEGEENKLSPQVICSLPTSPTPTVGPSDGIKWGKKAVAMLTVGATFWDGP